MKMIWLSLLLLATAVLSYGQTVLPGTSPPRQGLYPEGTAEDLWGSKIDLGTALGSKTVTIVPFSTSTCGYCLDDGFFEDRNYIHPNEEKGGVSWHMCLFSSQLDVCSFQKHFGWKNQVMTWPPALQRFQDGGFPSLLAFKNGDQVLSYFDNYTMFDTLKTLLWDTNTKMIPTGNMHMAERFIFENERDAAVMVFPRNAAIDSATILFGIKSHSFHCRHIDDLAPDDLKKHLYLAGKFSFTEFTGLVGAREIPLKLKNGEVLLGDYSFSFDSTGIYSCFPSPFNPEKYMILDMAHGNKRFALANYLDFILYRGTEPGNFSRLAYGHFDKTDPFHWKTNPGNIFSDRDLHRYCKTTCPLPVKPERDHDLDESIPVTIIHAKSKLGQSWTIGNANCRFPDIITCEETGTWVAWEESGNILLTRPDAREKTIYYIENDKSDSYNPRLAIANGHLWVFWLNNRDGYYRVYGRYLANGVLSDEILLSGIDACDAVTLTAASSTHGITIAWSDWKGNSRYLKKRTISDGVMEDITNILPVPSPDIEGYSNAWAPSACYSPDGKICAVWNQHYPGSFCVCGGDLTGDPIPVTKSAVKMNDWEVGGYPSVSADGRNRLHAVWESSGWDVFYKNKPQQVRYACFNDRLKKWSLGETVSGNRMMINQNPVIAADRLDNILVTWSGRDPGKNDPWQIYLAVKMVGGWSDPVPLSEPGVNSRFPRMSYDSTHNELWISWHAGEGEQMKTRVMKLRVKDVIREVNEKAKSEVQTRSND
jgi:hypothetical protein